MTNNIFDLNQFRNFHFKRPKKRGRPSKLSKMKYPMDLIVTITYFDPVKDEEITVNLQPDESIFPLNSMSSQYKKVMVELMLGITAEMCEGDPAMICELQEWLEQCFMNKEEEK
jgi:hypothetical protein